MSFRTLLAAALVASVALPALAQPRTADIEKRGFKRADFPRLAKLSENVYTFEGIHPPNFTTVSLIVVGRDGVLVADGQGTTVETQAMLDAIKTITDKPVKWYVVGSDHGDHTAGNSVLPKDITFVVHPNSRAQMEKDAATVMGQNLKAAAEAMTKGGPAPTPRPAVVVPPTAMSGDRQSIDIGGTEVQVLFLGRAHTGGDLNVYLPKQRLLFMSEVYLNRVFPAMRSAYPSEWVKTIDRALAMDIDRYIPGHGFVEEPKAAREELVEFQKATKAVIVEVTRLHRLGLSVDDAIAQANWGPYTDWYLRDSQAPIAVRKIYEELEGKLK
ncbi:MAG: MBL fold metallo-hydrolase [Acidobacteriota bacterium]